MDNYNQNNGQINNQQQDGNYQQNYGAPQNGSYNYQQNYGAPQGPMKPKDPGQGFSIAGMVCGIVGLVLCWAYGIGIIPSVVGLVLSVVGRKKSIEAGFNNSGMATAGLVCACISLGLSVLVGLSCAACVGCSSCTTSSLLSGY